MLLAVAHLVHADVVQVVQAAVVELIGHDAGHDRAGGRPLYSGVALTLHSLVTAVLSTCLTSQAMRSSKSRVRRDPWRANGTASTTTLRHGRQASLRSWARTSTRQTPKSSARHVDSRGCQLCRARVVHPQCGQISRRRRSRTSTVTAWSSLLNSTALTQTPARSSSRLNMVVARTACDPLISVPWTARDRGEGRAHLHRVSCTPPNRLLTSTDARSGSRQ
ncbi:hypothetical protein BH23ACT10_BH23ACT10_20590 [soil metagenome]